ncbi:MAG: replicative DNA helicase [Clostridiaceae bacterium]
MNDAERSVLGSALIEPSCVPMVCGELVDEDFTSTTTLEVFRGIKSLWQSGAAVDLVTLSNELERHNRLDAAGGMEFLTDLVTFVPTAANVRNYIEVLQSSRQVRTFTSGMRKAVAAAEDGEDGYLDSARQVLDTVSAIGASGVTRLGDCLPEVANRLGNNTRGISTGYVALDAVTRGLQPGHLIIIGARPGIGKTALACNIAANLCRSGRAVAYFSLEMSSTEIAERINLSEAMVDKYEAYRGSKEAIKSVLDTQERLSSWELFIDDRGSLSVGQVVAGCYKFRQSAGRLDCIVVDYLQLLRIPAKKSSSRSEDLGIATRALKILAKELKCPVVLLSQLNRNAAGKRPLVADLRESGSIEQDADIVILLHREDDKPESRESTLIVGKNRHGRTGDIKLVWNAAYTRFMEEPFPTVEIPKGLFDK